jgi:hypothetical protein
MKTSLIFLALIALCGTALPAQAQEQLTTLEAYGGFDYIRFNINANLSGVAPSQSYNASGGGGQLEYNPNRWLGVVGDLAGYAATNQGTVVAGAFTYLFGPRVNLRRSRVTPFGQVLFGGMAATSEIGHPGAANHFAMSAGGGLDFQVSRIVSIRPMQAEYLMTRYPNGLNNRQDNFRYSTGIVFRFSRK